MVRLKNTHVNEWQCDAGMYVDEVQSFLLWTKDWMFI
jgi:hypothetical protein